MSSFRDKNVRLPMGEGRQFCRSLHARLPRVNSVLREARMTLERILWIVPDRFRS